MARYFMALTLVVFMSTTATAQVVNNIRFYLETYISPDNELSTTLTTIPWGYNTQTVPLKYVSYATMNLDCTVDPVTRAITSINYIDFTGGSFKLESKTFTYDENTIDMNNVAGTFQTPSPHGSISSSTSSPTMPYTNVTTFPTGEHNIKLTSGTFVIDPLIGATVTYTLNSTSRTLICNTPGQTATLTTQLTSIDGDIAFYNATLNFPVDFSTSITDPNGYLTEFAGTANLVATATFSMEPLPEPPTPPVANDDYYETVKDGFFTVTPPNGVLVNDTDINEEDDLTAHKLTDPSNGYIGFYLTGGFQYYPMSGFVGRDSFTYRAYDGEFYSDPATVYIDVLADYLEIPGDANEDNVVDAADALIVANNWNKSYTGHTYGDFNNDGIVNAADAAIMSANWGDHNESAQGSAVPEPSTMILLLTGLLAVGLSRRR